ncbi:hypothetical protein KWH76_23435, partial [Enterobacter roggenkampii]|nr:hypothetical protein [Enterobacter roggenkampii]
MDFIRTRTISNRKNRIYTYKQSDRTVRTPIDIEKWNRKEHFNFFKTFDDPFFGMTANVDFTPVYNYSKDK